MVPDLSGTRDWFRGRQFFHGLGLWVDAFKTIQARYVYYALYFYLLRQFPLRSSGIRSQGLGTPALDISALGVLKVCRRPGGFRGHEPNENGWSKDS